MKLNGILRTNYMKVKIQEIINNHENTPLKQRSHMQNIKDMHPIRFGWIGSLESWVELGFTAHQHILGYMAPNRKDDFG